MRRSACLLATLVAIFSLSLFAQTPDSVTIRGRVVDPSGAVVPGVEIRVTNQRTSTARTTASDASGFFSLSGLQAGDYVLESHKQGFANLIRPLTLAGDRTADIKLQLNVESAETKVAVTGTVGEVRTDQPQLGD